MRTVEDAHDASVAPVAIAWAIAKGTTPLIGATKPPHVSDDAARAAQISLDADEVASLEAAASATGVGTKGGVGGADGLSPGRSRVPGVFPPRRVEPHVTSRNGT